MPTQDLFLSKTKERTNGLTNRIESLTDQLKGDPNSIVPTPSKTSVAFSIKVADSASLLQEDEISAAPMLSLMLVKY